MARIMSRKEINERLAEQIRECGLSLARDAEWIAGDIPNRTDEFVITITFGDDHIPIIETNSVFYPSIIYDRYRNLNKGGLFAKSCTQRPAGSDDSDPPAL